MDTLFMLASGSGVLLVRFIYKTLKYKLVDKKKEETRIKTIYEEYSIGIESYLIKIANLKQEQEKNFFESRDITTKIRNEREMIERDFNRFLYKIGLSKNDLMKYKKFRIKEKPN